MKVVVHKVDNGELVDQLRRIADLLENLIYTTNSPQQMFETDDNPANRLFYSNEMDEIVEHKLNQMGRAYRPRK